MFSSSGKRFEATNPEPDHAYVEFVGELAGAPQPLISVEVNTFQPGVVTFYLPLDRADLAAATSRRSSAVRAQMAYVRAFRRELGIGVDALNSAG